MTTPRPAPTSAAPSSKQADESDRQRNALENQGAQGRPGGETWTREQLLRENDDDETATRH